jgi:hypothetical protein
VKDSPGVVPVWRDMVPQGAFAQSIYRKKLPPSIDYYLFFGYKGNRNPLRPNNDGVVTLATQLDPRVQAEAKMVYGFDEDHDSILTCNRVAALFANIIDADLEPPKGQPKGGTGMLRLAFSQAVSSGTPNIWAQVLLLPKNQTEKDGTGLPINALKDGTLLTVNALESGQVFGPFASGRYVVCLVAGGFRVKPTKQEVTIGAEQTDDLNFKLIPTGSVSGFITRRFYKGSDPAGTYMMYGFDVPLRAIRLTGMGETRTLNPFPDEHDLVMGTFDRFVEAFYSNPHYLDHE